MNPSQPPGRPVLHRLGRWRRVSRWALAPVRVALRLLAAIWLTLFCYVALVAGRAVMGTAARRDAWGIRVCSAWCRWLGRVAGWRLEVEGGPPEAPFLLVANHLSYVDVLLLGGAAGGTFVAKREIATWPVIGHLARAVGTVFIDRDAKRDLVRVSRVMEGALEAGKGVVIFPEGTTGDGSGLLPFKTSLLEVAAAEGRPVPWAVIEYATGPGQPPASRAVCWTGGALLVPHVLRLLTLPRFTARVTFGGEPVRGQDRKQLARRLRDVMSAQLAGREGGAPGPLGTN